MNTNFLIYNEKESLFLWVGPYVLKDIPKNAGFSWDKDKKQWCTNDPNVAGKLIKEASLQTQIKIKQLIREQDIKYVESFNPQCDIEIPHPADKDYFPSQKVAIKILADRGRGLHADPTGTGKTVVGIGVANTIDAKKILVVCPASVKTSWKKHFMSWLVSNSLIVLMNAGDLWPDTNNIERFVVIINYDILYRFTDKLKEKWDLVLVDESHYLKTVSSRRSKSFYENINADAAIFMSATPLKNHPMSCGHKYIGLILRLGHIPMATVSI